MNLVRLHSKILPLSHVCTHRVLSRVPRETAVRTGTAYTVFMDNYEILRFLSMAWEIAKKKKDMNRKYIIFAYHRIIQAAVHRRNWRTTFLKKGRPIMRP